MSELFEAQETTYCGIVEMPIIAPTLEPIVYAGLGCMVGMLTAFAIAASFMHGVLGQVKSLNQLGDIERSDEPEMEATKR